MSDNDAETLAHEFWNEAQRVGLVPVSTPWQFLPATDQEKVRRCITAVLAAERERLAPEKTAARTMVDERDPNCVETWPECHDGDYNPACCRFPKSCSAGGFRWADAPEDHP